MDTNTNSIHLTVSERNRLTAVCDSAAEGTEFCFSFFHEGQLIYSTPMRSRASAVCWMSEPGDYQVAVVKRFPDGSEISMDSDTVTFAGLPKPAPVKPPRESAVSSLRMVLSEVYENRKRLWRIAVFDFEIKNKDSYLGKIWSLLNPLLQIFTFWLVFGAGLRSNAPVDGYPFILWMLCGIIPWFFFSNGITSGSGCIYSKSSTVLKFRYPMATLPVSNALTNLIEHIWTLGIVLVMFLIYGYLPGIHWINIGYYMVYTVFFLSAIGLISSALTMVARDFQKLIPPLMRLVFYLTPILWTLDQMPEWLQPILKINPAFYIVNGYRDSLLYRTWFFERWREMLFFWGLNFLLLVVGSILHRRLRSQFADLI